MRTPCRTVPWAAARAPRPRHPPRRRAQLESGSARKSLTRERQDLEVQAHVLSIREQELKDRLAESDRRTARLELEIETLTTLLRKEQASRLAAERRASGPLAKPRRTNTTRTKRPVRKRATPSKRR